MHEKKKCHTDERDYLDTAKNDVDDALYLAIKSHNLPYTKATLDRITPVTYECGEVFLRHFLDFGTPDQKPLTEVRFVVAGDDEVDVKRVHAHYFKGSSNVPFLATA